MALWAVTGAEQVLDTPVYLTAVGVASGYPFVGGTLRIEAGAHAASAIWYRMSQRGTIDQMPPIGTEVVDQVGLDLMADWIDGL